jgi:hypothetical protein
VQLRRERLSAVDLTSLSVVSPLERLRHDRQRRLKGWRALFGQVGDGLGHAVHLEAAQHDDGATFGFMTDGAPPRSGGSVVSLDAGQWLVCQRQVLRCRRGGRVERLALNKAEQQVRDMRLGGRDCHDGQFAGAGIAR